MRRLAASMDSRMIAYANASATTGIPMIQMTKCIAIAYLLAAGHRHLQASARCYVSSCNSIGTLHNLPQLVAPCAEHGRRRRKIEAPHAVKTLVIVRAQLRPRLFEIGPPCHQRRVVVGTEIVPILD